MTTPTPTQLPAESFLRILEQIAQHAEFGKACGLTALPRPSVPNTPSERPHSSASRRVRTDDTDASDSFAPLRHRIDGCQRCALHANRAQIVFGRGNPRAAVMVIGAGPGEREDVQGLPFVGPAGELLTKILDAIQLRRDEVYLTNLVKCRPPDDREPESLEIAACDPFLQQEIATVRPRIICALGRCAAQALLQTDAALSELRGRFHERDGIRIMPTYHPDDLLRDPAHKREAWRDMQQVQQACREFVSATEADG